MEKKIPKINRINLYIDEFYSEFSSFCVKTDESSDLIKKSRSNLKKTNDFLFRSRDSKINIKDREKKNILGISIYTYLNSTIYRLWDLFYSILKLSKDDAYISSVIIQRLCYENIVHSRYFLEHIKKYIMNKNTQKYWDLIYEFVWSEVLHDETFQSDIRGIHIRGEKELPHINKSLTYYKEKVKRLLIKYDSKEHREKVDNMYQILTQMSHPNALGNTKFYAEGKLSDEGIPQYIFSNKHKKQKKNYFVMTEYFFREFVDHCFFLRNFKKELPSLLDDYKEYLLTKTTDIDAYMNDFIEKSQKKFNVFPPDTYN